MQLVVFNEEVRSWWNSFNSRKSESRLPLAIGLQLARFLVHPHKLVGVV